MPAVIDDTYAEAFRSIYVEFLITACNRRWVEHAVQAVTGNGSSTILCDCEAGLDRYVGPGTDEPVFTPDGRPGAVIQLHVPRFRKDRVRALEMASLVRISQNVLTCPTAACFNLIDSDTHFKLGRKVAFFGDGFQKRVERFGRKMWWIPTLGGEFLLDRRLGYAEGLMGGNIWYLGESAEAALAGAEAGVAAVAKCPGVIMPFPGGIVRSGSKVGSRYKKLKASTNDAYCPTLRCLVKSALPDGVNAVYEIVIDGIDQTTVEEATRVGVRAACIPGVLGITAGNYGGNLGPVHLYLHKLLQ